MNSLMPFFGASFLLIFIALLIFYVSAGNFESAIILHFDSYRGIDLLGAATIVYQTLALSGLIILINGFLSKTLFEKMRFFSYLLGPATLFFSVLIFIYILVIISVN